MVMAMAMAMTMATKAKMVCLSGVQFRGEAQGSEIFSFDCNGMRNRCLGRIKSKYNKHFTAAAAFGVGERNDFDNEFHFGVDYVKNGNDSGKKMFTEELDQLLHKSVSENVKNIGNAPLLVHVYTENEPESSPSQSSSSKAMKMVIEKATSETWPYIKQRWENSCYTVPNGIILVEELEYKNNINTTQQLYHDKTYWLDYTTSTTSNKQLNESKSSTRLWGVLVQGIGLHFPACYLLKTCKVDCCFGSTTHFCLAKVDSFGKSIDFHLNRMWLQR